MISEIPELYKFNRGEESPEINIVFSINDRQSTSEDAGSGSETIMSVMKTLTGWALDDIENNLASYASFKINIGIHRYLGSDGNLFFTKDVATNGFTDVRNDLDNITSNLSLDTTDYQGLFNRAESLDFFPSNKPSINLAFIFTAFDPTVSTIDDRYEVFDGSSGDMLNPNNGAWNRMKGTAVNTFCFDVGNNRTAEFEADFFPRLDNTSQDGRPLFIQSTGNTLNVLSAIDTFKYDSAVSEWRFTSADRDITYDGELYTAVPIGRNSPESGKEINRANMDIEMSRSVTFADSAIRYVAEAITSVTVLKLTSPTTAEVFWKGRLSNTKPEGNKVILECESIFTSLRRPGLRARFQRNCRHVLYGSGCGVNRELYKLEGTYEDITGTVITAAFASAKPDGWFTGGIAKAPDGTLRFILKHVGSTLTLSRRFDSLEQTGTVNSTILTLYPGCPHNRDSCHNKFNNILNYGGFPWIPTKNPMGGNSLI